MYHIVQNTLCGSKLNVYLNGIILNEDCTYYMWLNMAFEINALKSRQEDKPSIVIQTEPLPQTANVKIASDYHERKTQWYFMVITGIIDDMNLDVRKHIF